MSPLRTDPLFLLAVLYVLAAGAEFFAPYSRQWRDLGWQFPIAYLAASLRARRAGRRWYHDNRFEVEARESTRRPIPR